MTLTKEQLKLIKLPTSELLKISRASRFPWEVCAQIKVDFEWEAAGRTYDLVIATRRELQLWREAGAIPNDRSTLLQWATAELERPCHLCKQHKIEFTLMPEGFRTLCRICLWCYASMTGKETIQ